MSVLRPGIAAKAKVRVLHQCCGDGTFFGEISDMNVQATGIDAFETIKALQ